MAKEKFLIIASLMHDDCFSRFSETKNRELIDSGALDDPNGPFSRNPYSWIEASFEIKLVRHREATHICSFTPSAYYVWIQNYFVGIPNAAWEKDGDPEGLELENGGEFVGYGTYRDEYDPRFICETFTVDSMRHCGLRKPTVRHTLSFRTDKENDALDKYTEAIWKVAEETASELNCNGVAGQAPILDVWTYRQWQRELRLKAMGQAA